MGMIERLDPELIAPLQDYLALLGGELSLRDIPSTRARAAQVRADMMARLPAIEGVTSADHLLPGSAGAPNVRVRVYRPTDRSAATLPALLWIHGGGYVLGTLEQDDYRARNLALRTNCVVVSVEYRLAPEHPFPAPLEDCYTALKWVAAQAGTLGIDSARIAVGGASAGGGLAAGLALLARDRAEVNLAFQLLICPMLDDRNIAPAGDGQEDTLLWTRENNCIGWQSYLGPAVGDKRISPYAAAHRAADLTGLPPAYIPVGELDLFLYEDMDYARRLMEAGVATELHVYPGAFHGFEGVAPNARVSHQFATDLESALKRALNPS